MTASGARPFESDDPRLHSYADDPVTGEPIDVTHVPLALRGEGGVVTTTTDMIRFLDALLVDKTLLGPQSLAAMSGFVDYFSENGGTAAFGLGLGRETLADGRTFVGFSGLTLGTESSSYLDTATGGIGSIAVTRADVGSFGSVIALAAAVDAAAAWAAPASLDGPVVVASGAAADLRLLGGPEGLALSLDGARLTLPRSLADLKAAGVSFADGSVLAIGSAAGDAIDLAREHPSARAADNQILGLGGDDRLTGASGEDRILGGGGADRVLGGAGGDALFGGSGADRVVGGSGGDRLVGGPGSDILIGGAGRDVFVFREGDAGPGCPDVVRDFTTGVDRVDLRAIDAGAGVGDDAFRWIGGAAFSGAAGELRFDAADRAGVLEADVDGDGAADLAWRLIGVTGMSAEDFLL